MGSYEVQSGDNLWKIVKTTFKLTDATQINEKVKEIATLNKIKNTNSIFIGQKLNLGETEKEETSNTLPKTATRSFEFGKEPTEMKVPTEQPKQNELAEIQPKKEAPQTLPGPIKAEKQDFQIGWEVEKFKPEPYTQNEEQPTIPLKQKTTQQPKIQKQEQPVQEKPIPSTTPTAEKADTTALPGPVAFTTPEAQQNNWEKIKNREVPNILAEIIPQQIDAEADTISTPTSSQQNTKTTEGEISNPWFNSPEKYLEEIMNHMDAEKTSETNTANTTKKSDLPDFLNVNPQPKEEPILKAPKLTMAQYSEISVTTMFTGNANDINKHLKGVLEGKGEKFIELQEKYGINAAFLAGIVMNESANGTSNLAIKNKNVGGVRIPGSRRFKKYDDVGECIEHMAKFLSDHYIQEGRTTIGAIGAKYCPVTDETDEDNLNQYWPRNVGSNMAKIDPKNTIA